MSKIVGIDLGTANSLAALLAGGEPVIITVSEGSRLLPSVVAFIKTGERWLSPMTRRLDDLKQKNNAFSIRRFIGQHFGEAPKVHSHVPFRVVEAPARDGFVPIPQINPAESPQVVSAMILQKLKQDAEAQLGEPVTGVVITVPEYFTDLQCQATQAAGKIAGLEVLRIINEPLMDGLDKKKDETNLMFDLDALVIIRSGVPLNKKKDETILVFDLGGKTSDVSVLTEGEGVIEVKATRGDTHLGSDDWDAVLAGYIADEFNKEQDIDLRMDSHAFQRLNEAAEKAKIELSSMLETEVNLPSITVSASGPQDLKIKITRTKFEQLCAPLVQRCRGLFEAVLRDAKRKPAGLDELVLVGGATRMPMIQQLVLELSLSDRLDGVVATR